ncbi:MAG: M20 family metallopeptidase [Deltaproteobacteria bacterium]|nr:M20 family metallopeptidase [Deltaproteobacteria bacterium]
MNRVLKLLSDREQEMFTLLQKMVLIQSGTRNKKGVDRVGQLVGNYLADLPLSCKRIEQKQLGDHLVFTTPAAGLGKYILITGHMDTVFPEDTDFNWYREDTTKIYGPGVIDMKGGLVVTMSAVRALADTGLLEQIPLVLVFNSDEEIGSPTSIPLVEELARGACCALVTECGGIEGQVVTGRRGKTGYRLDVHGRAGHAAFAGKDKASAILELCRLVPEFENLNDAETGLVVNVGVIEGGVGQNSVAEHAGALIDSRFCSVEQGESLQRDIFQLAAVPGIPGTRSRITVTNRRPVMIQSAANQKLYSIIRQQAGKLGIRISDELRQGVSDASNIAGQGVPVVDGLGPVGENDHSDREYMIKDSLPARCRLLAASILELDRLNFSATEE